MIIIPIKWLFHWEYTQHFQTKPHVLTSISLCSGPQVCANSIPRSIYMAHNSCGTHSWMTSCQRGTPGAKEKKYEEVGVGRVGGRRKRTTKRRRSCTFVKIWRPSPGRWESPKSLFFMLQTAINIQTSTNHMATFHHLLHTTSSLLWFPQRPSLPLLEAAIRPDADLWPVRPGQLEKGRDSYPSWA